MRVVLSWLQELVDIRESARDLAQALTMAGLAVDAVTEESAETIFELDVTANRPDALNHIGVAREIAALFGRELRRPPVSIHQSRQAASSLASITVADPDLCSRYTARVAIGNRIAASPDWMRKRLELCGIRSINNVADITNYVLLEMGHPTHAFDLDLLRGGRIIVRRPLPGERLRTLDGVERTLTRDNLVIADVDHPVGLAGVMGGEESEISASTQNVLIEAAWFNPAATRRTARHFGLHTEASHRFERGADIEATTWATDRICALLEQLASATVLAGRIDVYPAPLVRARIQLREASLQRHIGVEIPPAEVERIFKGLEFAAERQDGEWMVTPPTGRMDVSREIDLVEEVARIFGYDRLPAHLPQWSGHSEASENARAEQRLREVARALGFDEAITLAFISSAEAERFGNWPAVKIRNPINESLDVMRNSAVPALLEAIDWNVYRGQNDARLFEIGRLYRTESDGFAEPPVLALAATGRAHSSRLNDPGRPFDFFDTKAAVVALIGAFSGGRVYFDQETDASYYYPGRSARVVVEGRTVGRFGQIHPDLAVEHKWRQPVFIAELWLDRLYKLGLREPHFRPLPRVPGVERDLSLLLPEGTRFEQIVTAVGQRPYLVRLRPVEIYRGGNVPAGKFSLLLRVMWQREDTTLTDDAVNGYARQIVETLQRELHAEQRIS